MLRFSFTTCLLALWLFPVAGLPQTPTVKPDPSSAAAATPRLSYDSAFTGYRALVEEVVAPWRDTNDIAGRIGGWRAYAREGRGSGPRETDQVSPPKPAADGTAGAPKSVDHSTTHRGAQ